MPLLCTSRAGAVRRAGMDPSATAGAHFTDRVEQLLAGITEQPGTRLPGDRRVQLSRKAEAAECIDLPDALLEELRALV